MKPNKCLRCGRDLADFTAIICEPCYAIISPPLPSVTWHMVRASICLALGIIFAGFLFMVTK